MPRNSPRDAGISHQLAPVIDIQVAVFAIRHRPVAFGGDLISVGTRIMDIRDRGRAALVVEPAIGLVVKSERTGRIGFFHIASAVQIPYLNTDSFAIDQKMMEGWFL